LPQSRANPAAPRLAPTDAYFSVTEIVIVDECVVGVTPGFVTMPFSPIVIVPVMMPPLNPPVNANVFVISDDVLLCVALMLAGEPVTGTVQLVVPPPILLQVRFAFPGLPVTVSTAGPDTVAVAEYDDVPAKAPVEAPDGIVTL